MPYSTPKTNWTSTDGVTDADLNRIEDNIKETYDRGVVGKSGTIGPLVDWNTYVTAGAYVVASASQFTAGYNAPVGAYGYGTLVVITTGVNLVTQTYYPHGTTQNEFYQRSKYNLSDWGAWHKFTPEIDFNIYRTAKDANGIFTTIEYKRPNSTLAIKSVLSGGTSPLYTTRTITYYGADGATVENTWTRTITYDADGDWLQEV